MVSLMMGVWFLSSAGANYMAGNLEAFLHTYEINIFAFLIGSSFAAAVLLFAISPLLRSWMNDKPGAVAAVASDSTSDFDTDATDDSFNAVDDASESSESESKDH
jgi:hypothetical protein